MKNKIEQLLLLLLLVLATAQSSAQESSEPARVVALQGEVMVQRAGGASEPLSRRQTLQVGDIIRTSFDAWLQLRFSDGGLLALSCNSVLEIRDYQYADRQNDRVQLFLHSGRARTITGAIQRSNYRFLTDMAEVTVVGTDYAVSADAANEHFFGVYDGAIRVRSGNEEIRLGVGHASNFAHLKSGEPPVGLPLQPPQLSTSVLGGVSCSE